MMLLPAFIPLLRHLPLPVAPIFSHSDQHSNALSCGPNRDGSEREAMDDENATETNKKERTKRSSAAEMIT